VSSLTTKTVCIITKGKCTKTNSRSRKIIAIVSIYGVFSVGVLV